MRDAAKAYLSKGNADRSWQDENFAYTLIQILRDEENWPDLRETAVRSNALCCAVTAASQSHRSASTAAHNDNRPRHFLSPNVSALVTKKDHLCVI